MNGTNHADEVWASDGVVSLTRFRASDVETMFLGDSDPEFRRRFDFPDDVVPSRAHSQAVLARWVEEWAQGTRFSFALRDAASGALLGGCELQSWAPGWANISYWTYPEFRRRGVATRALPLLRGIARDHFRIHQLELLADPDNVASRRVATRSGFMEVSERDGRVLYVAASAPGGSARTVIDKVLVYVLAARRLLVFTQPEAPGSGRQVPGGSLEPGETAVQAALREAEEETGLSGFTGIRYLGSRLFESRTWIDLLFHRHFFLLEHPGTAVERWQHWERTPSTGGAPILFDFQWVPLAEVTLDWEMDALLVAL